jgi:hypothetical protein
MIETKPLFYFGIQITEPNSWIDFQEFAGPVKSVQLNLGNYTPSTFATELARAMTSGSTLEYVATLDRATRLITITTTTNFRFLQGTGPHSGDGAWNEISFGGDTGYALFHTNINAVGDEWRPQFLPQDWVEFDHNVSSVDGTRKESTNGAVETVSFGLKYIMEMNFTFITNRYVDGPFDNDKAGVENALAFLNYATTSADLEFMQDRDQPDNFQLCILESTPENQNGLAFKLKELYGKGLPGFYETGLLKFRRV